MRLIGHTLTKCKWVFNFQDESDKGDVTSLDDHIYHIVFFIYFYPSNQSMCEPLTPLIFKFQKNHRSTYLSPSNLTSS